MKTLVFAILLTLFFSTSILAGQEYLKYNPMADKWEYAVSGDCLKYNALENKWSYERPNSQLRYNPMEDEFEYAN